LVIFRAKLPDDLTLAEYSEIVGSIDLLVSLDTEIKPRIRSEEDLLRSPTSDSRFEVVRVQYGSDFMLVLAFAPYVGSAVAGAGLTFLSVAKGIKIIQEARDVNETRMGKKEERLRRAQERLRDEVRTPNRAAKGEVYVSPELIVRLNRERSNQNPKKLSAPYTPHELRALALLADYGFSVEVDQ
jgi:hypothetical protein